VDNFPHVISKKFTIFLMHSTPHTTILLCTKTYGWESCDQCAIVCYWMERRPNKHSHEILQ